MVAYLTLVFSLLPLLLFSGEFTANVNRNRINLGESITLNLVLKDASAKGNPSIDALKKTFSITSQHQLSNTVMVNGKMTSSTTWKLTLIPQKEGDAVIPSIWINTSKGILSSQPLTIQVAKRSAVQHSEVSDDSEVFLAIDVSNAKPYKNEPVIYTIRMLSKSDLANIQMQKIHLENAMIEAHGEPKITRKVFNGVSVNVIECDYLITPLKAGSLKIPSTIIQGMVPTRRNLSSSLFDDDFDPFSMMQGFDRLKPFAVATEEVVLDVQPPVADMNPWLPARSLRLEEVWDESQSLQVGEPFTRGFKVIAEGIKSSQLPSFADLQKSDPLFKIYADKPELGDEEKSGTLQSYRKEQYTLIPQQPGTQTLPELSVVWWDVEKKEKVVASIPSRTLQILPAPETSLKSEMTPAAEKTFSFPGQQEFVDQKNPLLYAFIAGLAVLLIAAIFWGILLQKKILRLTKPPVHRKVKEAPKKKPKKPAPSPSKNKNEKLPDLNPT